MEGLVLRSGHLWVEEEEAETVEHICEMLVGDVCVWEDRE